VYLHDTPSKSLFGRAQRAFSHGCIRVQNPIELGKMLIANDPGNPTTVEKFDQVIASGKTTTVILKQPLPIFLMYLTTNVQDGMVLFKPDLYSRDPGIFNALNRQPSPLKQPTQLPEIKGQNSMTIDKKENHVPPPARGMTGLHYAQGPL
jgi:murein L,D-transpeptidase YcbB/YkuD